MPAEMPLETIDAVLGSYASAARYMRRATLDYPFSSGIFEVRACLYSSNERGWGHVTAAELFLCHNQLAYSTVAELLRRGRIAPLGEIPIEEFREVQDTSSFIARMDGVRFSRPIPLGEFSGEMRIERYRVSDKRLYMWSSWTFEEGSARGETTFVADLR